MKWTYTETREPQVGEFRIKTKFAWLPIHLKGEARWLEKVTIKQEYCKYMGATEYFKLWEDIEFMEERK